MNLERETIPTLVKIYTALSGKLTLIVKKDGKLFPYYTDIPVDVPPCARRTAAIAAGIDIDET